MKRIYKTFDKFKKPKYPSLNITDALDSSSEPATSTSMAIITSTADPMPSVPTSAVTASVEVVQATSVNVTTGHERQLSASVSALAINDRAPVARLEDSPPDAIMQANLRSTESGKNPSHAGSAFFSNANLNIAGGTFVSLFRVPCT
ncbi:hypothetical protein BYT27DRAFT_7196456 [Phlegmacium glaucopus]|nr:hypothetical protein BYT27DRAFT_7196456 [Phlegmacium glaucopus]